MYICKERLHKQFCHHTLAQTEGNDVYTVCGRALQAENWPDNMQIKERAACIIIRRE